MHTVRITTEIRPGSVHCFKNASKIPLNFRGRAAMCLITQIFATAILWSIRRITWKFTLISYAQLFSVYTLNQWARRFPLTRKYLALPYTTERKYLWKEEDLWAWEYRRKNTELLKDEVLCESERKNTLAFIEMFLKIPNSCASF